MPKRRPRLTSEGRPHSYGSCLCGVTRRGPRIEFSAANAPPTAPPRARKTITGGWRRGPGRCYITAGGSLLHSGNRREIRAVTQAVVAGALALAVLNALPGVLGAWI